MPQVNPGLAKGYALDFAAPLRFVAEALAERARPLDELIEAYEHDPADLDRVWDHELRQRGQRRSAKPEVQEERRAEAKRWLLQAAVEALGDQVREGGERLALTVALDAVQVQGLPVAFDPARVTPRPASPRTKEPSRAQAVASKPEAEPEVVAEADAEAASAAEEQPEPEPPPPPNPFREWFDDHGYTDRSLARALGVTPTEVKAYREGEQPAPRVVLLALWAIDRGAEV